MNGPVVVEYGPHPLRIIEHEPVTLRDGTILSARVWLPLDDSGQPLQVPAILEAIPYRKDDITLIDDEVRFGYVAANGYAGVRLDLRGSGSSEGVLPDEYSRVERSDLLEALDWIAAQPWCDGSIGMTGMSWSGFNSLQLASERPASLKAIITVFSSDDRYDNDVHYMGGNVLAFYMAVWGAVMHAFNVRPPDPAVVGDKWESMWRERLEGNPLFTDLWLSHQRRDEYWKYGSVIENITAIECPVLAVGGWADAYTDTVFRLLDNLPDTTKAIVGPWGHTWPERGLPGPAIGFLQECIRWWDHWLKGADNGVDDDPRLRFWTQESVQLRPDLAERPGSWWQTSTIPAEQKADTTLYLGPDGSLGADSVLDDVDRSVRHRSSDAVGQHAGSWLPYGNPTDLAGNQAEEDEGSLVFDTNPLDEPLTIWGQPELELDIASDQRTGFVFVRLCDVDETGYSSIITRGALNLCHRDGHEKPSKLEPGVRYRVRVPLKNIAQTIPAGHRVRIGISTHYWPWIWPSAEPATITVGVDGTSALRLRTIGTRAEPMRIPFERPEIAKPPETTPLRERNPILETIGSRDLGASTLHLSRDLNGDTRYPSDYVIRDRDHAAFTITAGDPLSAAVRVTREMGFERDDSQVNIETMCTMTSTVTTYELGFQMKAVLNGVIVHEHDEQCSIDRDHT